MSKLLMDEVPLMCQPSLAVKIGLNEALFIQQLHYWLTSSKNIRDGKHWVYNTVDEWNKQFPFWSKATLKRTIASLEKMGLIQSANYNRISIDRTKWYTIDYEALCALETKNENSNNDRKTDESSNSSNCTNGLNQRGEEDFSVLQEAEDSSDSGIEPSMSANCTFPSGQNEPMDECNLHPPITRNNNRDYLPENTTTAKQEEHPNEDGAVVHDLSEQTAKCGIPSRTLQTFIKTYGQENVQKQMDLLQKALKRNHINNPAGWLRMALREGYTDAAVELARIKNERKAEAKKRADEFTKRQLAAYAEIDAKEQEKIEIDPSSPFHAFLKKIKQKRQQEGPAS